MIQGFVLLVALVAIVAGFMLYFSSERLVASRAGRLAMLLGVALLPSVALVGGASYAYEESSTTEFCLSCHEMDNHGKSLFVDDTTALPAVHYQKRLVDRDHACFACHTDYAMFGDVKAKINGLRHVWVHYLGEAPETLELYAPYSNANCLHCHDDARSFVEAAVHHDHLDALYTGEQSCLQCHAKGHALDQVEQGNFWLANP
jgi:cytochrome c-type protein NapC